MTAGKASRFTWALLAVVMLRWNGAGEALAQAGFPPRLENYITEVVALTADEKKRLFDGAPVAKNLRADASKEVALFGAIWIQAPIARYLNLLQDIENFEKGPGFRVTKKVSDPARIDDFSALVLPDEFPNAVLPLAYTVAIRSLAQMQFGAVVDAHRAGGGRIGSWWRVVGIGFLSLIVIGGVFFAIVLALVYAGVLE